MRSKQERNQIITSEEKGRLRNHCAKLTKTKRFKKENSPTRGNSSKGMASWDFPNLL